MTFYRDFRAKSIGTPRKTVKTGKTRILTDNIFGESVALSKTSFPTFYPQTAESICIVQIFLWRWVFFALAF
jgi:hypothetical protein